VNIVFSEYRDIVVSPFTELMNNPQGLSFHRGGPHWPDWDNQTFPRHNRGGRPVDHEPVSVDEAEPVSGTFVWGAPLVRHFGHQIADFMTRIPDSHFRFPDATLLLAGHPRDNFHSYDSLAGYMRAILDWFDVPPQRVHVVDRPIRISNLYVVPQAEQAQGIGPAPDYVDRLNGICLRKLTVPRDLDTVYVTRSEQAASFAGEALIDDALEKAGVTVVVPETLPLMEQLEVYCRARRLIFSEGSAVHCLQLLGNAQINQVHILSRRPKFQIAKANLLPRAASLNYVDVGAELIHGTNLKGGPAPETGISLPSRDRLIDFFGEQGIAIKSSLSKQTFAKAQLDDVRTWLAAEVKLPRSQSDAYWSMLRETVGGLGDETVRTAVEKLVHTETTSR